MNPYEILGVSENADQETVKKAYRNLVRKYHPDRYVNNPLADLASEKLKEINVAYDMIENNGKYQHIKDENKGEKTYSNESDKNKYSDEEISFNRVRYLLELGLTEDAVDVLKKLPRNAEWYYLSGVAEIARGRYNNAVNYIKTAISMEPDNSEYKNALDTLNDRASHYDNEGEKQKNYGADCCLGGCLFVYICPYLCIGGCLCECLCSPDCC